MKKVIWLFGRAGSGRKTFIDNITNLPEDIKTSLGIENTRISCVVEPYEERVGFSYVESQQRKSTTYAHINHFLRGENDVLVLMGESVDYDETHDLLNTISHEYPNIEKEIVLLCPKDLDVLYERLINSEWFNSNNKRTTDNYPREWLDISISHLRKQLRKYEDNGYRFIEIDTTNGYSIDKEDEDRRHHRI